MLCMEVPEEDMEVQEETVFPHLFSIHSVNHIVDQDPCIFCNIFLFLFEKYFSNTRQLTQFTNGPTQFTIVWDDFILHPIISLCIHNMKIFTLSFLFMKK